jgi:hypothetical protein
VIGFAVESPAHDESLPGPDTLRYLPQIGHAVTGTGAMLAGALAMAADLVADRENRRLRALARPGRGHRSARHRRGFNPALRRVRHPGTPPVDRLQIGALLHRYENAAAASVIFVIGALTLVAGSLLLAVALTAHTSLRSGAARWSRSAWSRTSPRSPPAVARC